MPVDRFEGAMTRYRYCLNTAFDAGEKRHPETVIREMFPEASDLEPVSIADCWLFESGNVRAKKPLPDYFVELTSAPAVDVRWFDILPDGSVVPTDRTIVIKCEPLYEISYSIDRKPS